MAPQVVDIVAKDIHVLIEMKATELQLLKTAMSMCEGTPLSEEQKKAWRYFIEEFYPAIDSLVTELEKNNNVS